MKKTPDPVAISGVQIAAECSAASDVERRLASGLRVVSFLTLLSRMLGLARDMGMAALFGNGVMLDAFSVAFRIPNLFRRLFGEGALSTAFLPAFVREVEQSGREAGWRLASALFGTLAIGLTALVLVGELALWSLSEFGGLPPDTQLLLRITAVLLPYLILICVSAQVWAVLNALDHFTWPALSPTILNVVWLAAIWLMAPRCASPVTQLYVISACIVAAGLLQLTTSLPTLYRLGFRFDAAWKTALGQVLPIGRAMLPVVVGLSITQLNAFCDSLIAWSFSPPAGAAETVAGSEHGSWPLEIGTASALYLGQRMYHLPVGVFAIALGTVLFPLLSRHAQRGDFDLLQRDLSLGLRLVIVIGFPASAGLVLLARPLTVLLFQHGQFDAEDVRQTAQMIAAYGCGVWAICGLQIAQRGYYAIGDPGTPLRIGCAAVVLDLILNLTLIWPLGGWGLAISTSISAMLQLIAVVWIWRTRVGNLHWRSLLHTAGLTAVATAAMSGAGYATLSLVEGDDTAVDRLFEVVVPIVASAAAFFVAAKILGIEELRFLMRRRFEE